MIAVVVAVGLVVLVLVSERRRARRVAGVREALWLPKLSGPPTTSVFMVACAVLLGAALLTPSRASRDAPESDPDPALILVLDVSRSMTVTDVGPNRLSAALSTALRFTASAPPGPIGLVAFAGDAQLVVPPTVDRRLITTQLEALNPESASRPGSDLSNALAVSLQALGEGQAPGSIVILSDGEGFEEEHRRAEAVSEATQRGVPVHWITVGTSAGGPVPGENAAAHSSANPAIGRAVAASTGGIAVDAGGGGALAQILTALSATPAQDTDELEVPEAPSRASAHLFAFLAFLVLGLETLGFGRPPWGRV